MRTKLTPLQAQREHFELLDRFERRGLRYDTDGPKLAECPYCGVVTQYHRDHSCGGLRSEGNDPHNDR